MKRYRLRSIGIRNVEEADSVRLRAAGRPRTDGVETGHPSQGARRAAWGCAGLSLRPAALLRRAGRRLLKRWIRFIRTRLAPILRSMTLDDSQSREAICWPSSPPCPTQADAVGPLCCSSSSRACPRGFDALPRREHRQGPARPGGHRTRHDPSIAHAGALGAAFRPSKAWPQIPRCAARRAQHTRQRLRHLHR